MICLDIHSLLQKVAFAALISLNVLPVAGRRHKTVPPPYLASRGMPFTVVDVRRTDTATVLCATVNADAHTWKLAPAPYLVWDDSIRLPLRRATVYDRRTRPHTAHPYVPDSTYQRNVDVNGKSIAALDSVVLVFPPLPRGVDVVTLETDTGRYTSRIFHLRTDGRLFPVRTDKPQRIKNSELPNWQPGKKTAVVSGRILNYVPGTPIDYSYTFGVDDFFPDAEGIKFDINYKTGHYRFTVPITAPYQLNFSMGNKQCLHLMLCPGDSVTLNFDFEALANARSMPVEPSPRYLPAGIVTDAPMAPLLAVYPILGQWKAANSRFEYAVLDSLADETFAEFTERYWQEHRARMTEIDRRRDLTPAQHDYLELASEAIYLQQRRLFGFIKSMIPKLQSDSVRLAAFKAQQTPIDSHAAELKLPTSMQGAYALHNTWFNEYFEANGLTDTPMGQWLADMAYAKSLHAEINSLHPVANPARWDSVAPQYRPDLLALNEKIAASLSLQNDTTLSGICRLPDCAPDSLLAALIEPHLGHAVLVDLWATWCGPCLRGMKAMESVKKELLDAGVHFVYITDESSSYDGWKDAARLHAGAHYRIRQSVIQQMGIPNYHGSYPHYLIYDCKGRLLKSFIGWTDKYLDEFRTLLLQGMKPGT